MPRYLDFLDGPVEVSEFGNVRLARTPTGLRISVDGAPFRDILTSFQPSGRFISVSFLTGNDSAGGYADTMELADAHPIKTLTALNDRLPAVGLETDLTIHLLDDYPVSEEDRIILTNLRSRSYDNRVLFLGAKRPAAPPSFTVELAMTEALPGTVTYHDGPGPGKSIRVIGSGDGLVINGVMPADSSQVRVLIAGEAAAANNGLYRVSENHTNGGGTFIATLFRTDDYDTNAQIQTGNFVRVTGGNVYAGRNFELVSTIINVDVSPLSFTLLAAGVIPTAALSPSNSGVITAYQPANPATNAPATMTIAGLPASDSWGPLVGKMIQRADGAKTSWVLADLGSKTARIKQPDNSDPLNSVVGSRVEFAVGESVVIYDLPSIPIYPLPATLFTRDFAIGATTGNAIVANVRLASAGEASHVDLGCSPGSAIQCAVVDAAITGGLATSWSSCLFLGDAIHLSFWGGALAVALNGCAFLNSSMLLQGSQMTLTSSLDVEGAQGGGFPTFLMQRHCALQTTACRCGIFRSDVPFVTGNVGSLLNDEAGGSPIYGANNTAAILSQPVGSNWTIDAAGATVTTSAPHPIVGGIGAHDWADVPIVEIDTLTALQNA